MLWHNKDMPKKEHGFTLPELLVVSGVLLILVVVSTFLLSSKTDPARSRDAMRQVDVAILLNAIKEYEQDHGKLPASVSSEKRFVGSADDESDLCVDLVPKYLEDVPFDPVAGAADSIDSCHDGSVDYITAYEVQRIGDFVTVSSRLAETGRKIQASYKF